MNFSGHPVVIEYAIQECFKHRTPKTAATTTKKKLSGSTNLFINSGREIVEVDEQELENNVWLRMAQLVIKNESIFQVGKETFNIQCVLSHFGQKINPKNVKQLTEAVAHLKSLG